MKNALGRFLRLEYGLPSYTTRSRGCLKTHKGRRRIRTRFDKLDAMFLVVGSTHKIPFDACWLRSGDCDSIKRIEKPLLEFIELDKGNEAKP